MKMNLVLAVASAFAAISAGASGNAPWIGDGRSLPEGAAWYADRPAPEFRASFPSPQCGRPVTLRIATPCYFDLAVNGRRLTPCSAMTLWSPFDHTIYAEDFTVDPALLRAAPASNVVTVALGNGFYNLPPFKLWGCHVFRNVLSSGAPVFKAYVDGVPLSGWEWRETPVMRNCVYLGAVVDATRRPGEWRAAVESAGPKGRIVKRAAPPVAQYGRLCGKSRWLREGEVQVVDFGANATGVPEFRFADVRRGDRVEIVYGERLNDDGSVNVLTQTAGQVKPKGKGFVLDDSPGNRAAADEKFGVGCPCPAAQRDEYVCSGAKGGETFVPPFVWHVCRYAEVRGLKRLLGDGDAALVLTSSQVVDTPLAAAFRASDPRIARIHEMCRRTFRSNLMGVQSDCPGRERLGYGGDIVAACDAYCLNWDMREFYLKTLQDFADEAADDGWLTETAPHVGMVSQGMGGRAGPISWTLAVPVLMDALLRHYGDERALAYYPVCARYSRLVAAKYPDGYIPKCRGDHEALERAPNDLTATAHWHEFLRLTASFAERLGRKEDAAEFRALAAKVSALFAERWVGEDGTVANGTQSAQSIALCLGLVPERLRSAAFAKLVEAVEAKGCAPTTGIFSTRYMLMFLSENGRADLARRVVLHEGFPGWLHMLDRGATTIWETWKESDDVYSNCHPMFGSVDEWILRYAFDNASLRE